MEKKNITGERIKQVRGSKGLRLIDVVVTLHQDYQIQMDYSALARIESGQRKLSDYELLALTKILDVTAKWLLEGEG